MLCARWTIENASAHAPTGRSLSARRPSGRTRLHPNPTGALVRTKLAQLRLDTPGWLAGTVAVGLEGADVHTQRVNPRSDLFRVRERYLSLLLSYPGSELQCMVR